MMSGSAVERARDREDLYESYMVELQKKERAKAAEEHKRNIMEYRAFLESCDFIKANTQWRKVQDRLEDDERCSRLEKIDRLEIFQEYIHDLEKEEVEQRKIQKEQIRRLERKNRDEFRKLMEGHIATGVLTAKTHWRDYCMQVKDSAPYLAVSSNTSGSTPKDLFEDVAEELDKQYDEDKAQVKEAMKVGKIVLASSWTFENFKSAISEEGTLKGKGISDINLKPEGRRRGPRAAAAAPTADRLAAEQAPKRRIPTAKFWRSPTSEFSPFPSCGPQPRSLKPTTSSARAASAGCTKGGSTRRRSIRRGAASE